MTNSIPESRQMTTDKYVPPVDEEHAAILPRLKETLAGSPMSVSADRPATAPDVIYLQQAGRSLLDWSWCDDRQDDTDIEYRIVPSAERPAEQGDLRWRIGAWAAMTPDPELADSLRRLLRETSPAADQPRDCARAKSDMTPCIIRDGEMALADDDACVGCGWRPPPAADRPVENSGASPKAHDLIARYFQSVVAYHGEAHHDFEDTQSRAVAMGERDGDLAEYITSLEAEVSRLKSPRPVENSELREALDEIQIAAGEWAVAGVVGKERSVKRSLAARSRIIELFDRAVEQARREGPR